MLRWIYAILHTSKNISALKMLENLSFSNALLTSDCMPQSLPSSFLFCLNCSGLERPTFKKKKNTIINSQSTYINTQLIKFARVPWQAFLYRFIQRCHHGQEKFTQVKQQWYCKHRLFTSVLKWIVRYVCRTFCKCRMYFMFIFMIYQPTDLSQRALLQPFISIFSYSANTNNLHIRR